MAAFRTRVPELDGIRGVAILIVVVYHYLVLEGQAPLSPRLLPLALMGWSGVDLFFVLSGFLIGGILLDVRGAANYYRVFYARRCYRILPLYMVLCVAVGLVYVSGLTSDTPVRAWLFNEKLPWYAYLSFGQNVWMVARGAMDARAIDATWSLAIEEQFYLAVPFIIRIVPERWLPVVLGAGVVAAPAARVACRLALGAGAGDMGAYALTPCRMDALLVGVLAAWALRRPRVIGWLERHGVALYAAAAVCGAGVAYLILRRSDLGSPAVISWGYTCVALFYVTALLLAVTQPSGPLAWALRRRPLMGAGTLAYFVYLFHMPVLGLAHWALRGTTPELATPGAWATTALASVVVFGLARASWTWFERPLLRRGHRHEYRASQVGQADDGRSLARPAGAP
jgi:peptidoglycan/LPS O-acetylase OafA/YrhL